jgi:hypothetical protein
LFQLNKNKKTKIKIKEVPMCYSGSCNYEGFFGDCLLKNEKVLDFNSPLVEVIGTCVLKNNKKEEKGLEIVVK